MAPTRPNAAPAADRGVDRARTGGGGRRLATVATDFLLDPAERLVEQERALMTGMLLGLVETLADEIRVRVPQELAERCECTPMELLEQLRRAGLLANGKLIALLLRRADEVGVAGAAARSDPVVQSLTSDDVPAVAAAAMSVVLARAAATDRLGRPGLGLTDCDAETAVFMSYAVAAALASRAAGDEETLLAAAVDLLGRHDEGQRLHALEARLILALEGAGRLDDGLIARLAGAGEFGLLAEALGRRAGIGGDVAFDLIFAQGAEELALLLRMAECGRGLAGELIATAASALPHLDPLEAIAIFDGLSAAEVMEERSQLRRPPAFAEALQALRPHG